MFTRTVPPLLCTRLLSALGLTEEIVRDIPESRPGHRTRWTPRRRPGSRGGLPHPAPRPYPRRRRRSLSLQGIHCFADQSSGKTDIRQSSDFDVNANGIVPVCKFPITLHCGGSAVLCGFRRFCGCRGFVPAERQGSLLIVSRWIALVTLQCGGSPRTPLSKRLAIESKDGNMKNLFF